MGKNTQDFLVTSSMHLNQSSVLSYSIKSHITQNTNDAMCAHTFPIQNG